ncbi:cysteine-rich CWC family protein [Paracidovorax citrulli]
MVPVLTGQLRPVERCSQCATAFVCGYAAGLPLCWCTGQPLSPARLIVAGEHCLCPGCLAERQANAMKAGNPVTRVRDK